MSLRQLLMLPGYLIYTQRLCHDCLPVIRQSIPQCVHRAIEPQTPGCSVSLATAVAIVKR